MAESSGWDGRDPDALRALLGLPRLETYESISSTMDAVHALAGDGAPAGTLVLAERQETGRGRSGHGWMSEAGAGLWMTLLERPNDPAALEVLSIRLGLAAARALERFAGEPVRLKWPNDLFTHQGKLAGILVESRWRDGRPDWVAIGVGINTRIPAGVTHAAALPEGTSRFDLLAELLPALRGAASARGPLSPRELAAFAERDLARGRQCRQPAIGTVRGISAAGELIVQTTLGERTFRGGSLVLDGAGEST